MPKPVICAAICIALLGASPNPVSAANVFFTQESLKIIKADGTENLFRVELADSDAEREQGLMYRTDMADDHGMLFDFGTTRNVMMWMRNTNVALDMLFIADDYKVVTIARNAAPNSQEIIFSKVPVAYVLEVKAGTVDRLGIKVGSHIERIR